MLMQHTKHSQGHPATVLTAHGYDIIKHFYQSLLSTHLDLKNMFNMRHWERGRSRRRWRGGCIRKRPTLRARATVRHQSLRQTVQVSREHHIE